MESSNRKRALQSVILTVTAAVMAIIAFNMQGQVKVKESEGVTTFTRSQVAIELNIAYSGFRTSATTSSCSGVEPFRGISGSTIEFYDSDRFMIYKERIPRAKEKSGDTCTYVISVDKLPGLVRGEAFYRVIFPFGQTELEPVTLDGDEDLSATIALPLD